MDPVAEKRLRSGVWSHKSEQNFETGMPIETWTLDLIKLNEAMTHVMRTPHLMQEYATMPCEFVDRRFGEGTYKAMMTHGKDDYYRERRHLPITKYMGMDLARERDATMAYLYNSGTSTNTTTSTSGTTATYVSMMQDEMRRQMERETMYRMDTLYGHKVIPPGPTIKKGKRDKPISFRKKLVRNLPFVHGGDSLVQTLQREFDHWAGDQMKLLHG